MNSEERIGEPGNAQDEPLAPLGRPAILASLLISIILGALGQAQLAEQKIVFGLALFGAALPLFTATIIQGSGRALAGLDCEHFRPRLRQVLLHSGRRRTWGVVLCTLAVVAFFVSLGAFDPSGGRVTVGWYTYLASMILFSAGVLVATPAGEKVKRAPAPELHLLGAILLLALLLRVTQLSTIPAGIWYDEANIGLEARQLLQSLPTLPIYSNSMNQIAHHLVIFAGSLSLFGDTIFGLRMVSALFGVAGVLAAYLCGREARSGRFGLILAFIVATMRWHVNFSRIAMNGVDAPFFEFVSIYFALRLLRRPSGTLRSATGLGLSLGLGLCFYSPTRLFLAAFCLFTFTWWAIRSVRAFLQKRRSTQASNTTQPYGIALCVAVVILTAILAVLPTVRFAVTYPDVFWDRMHSVSIFAKADGADPMQLLRINTEKHLLMFNCCGDRNGRHNLPGAPTLDPVSAILLVLGIGLALSQSNAANRFFLLLLPVGLLGGILSLHFEAPQSLRSIGSIPAVAYLVALSLDGIWYIFLGNPASNPNLWKAVPVILVLVAIAILNTNTYFGEQAIHPQVRYEFMVDETEVAQRIVELGSDPIYYLDQEYYGSRIIAFEASEITSQYKMIQLLDPLPVREQPNQPVAYFVSVENGRIVETLQALYPQVVLEMLPNDPAFATTTYLALLQPEDLASVQGLDLEYWPGDSWPVEDTPTAVERVTSVDVAWPDGAAVEPPFFAAWSGVLYVPAYGWYELWTEAPDWVALTIDGSTQEGEQTLSYSGFLAEGNHKLRLVARYGNGDVRLYWQGTATATELVPQWALYASPVSVNGLLGKYYANPNWEGSPSMERVDSLLDIYFHHTPMPRPYSVEWTGLLVVPEGGRYELGLVAKDDASLYVDGSLVVATIGPNSYVGGWLEMEAGPHTIRVAYRDLTGYSNIHLYWTPPGGYREIIPSEYLWPGEWAYSTGE